MPQQPRRELRIPVHASVTYSDGLLNREGAVKDISMHGCLVESACPPKLGSLLSYQLSLPDAEVPLKIELGRVQWVQDNAFGLKVIEMSPDMQKRLRRFLEDNYMQMARARRARAQASQPAPEVARSTSTPSPFLWPPSTLAPKPMGTSVALAQSSPIEAAGSETAIPSRDVSSFVAWILDVRRACEEGQALPAAPAFTFKEFETCAGFIRRAVSQYSLTSHGSTAPESRPQSRLADVVSMVDELKSGLTLLDGARGKQSQRHLSRASAPVERDSDLSIQDRPEPRGFVDRLAALSWSLWEYLKLPDLANLRNRFKLFLCRASLWR